MSLCADKELLLHGLLDGELDAANTLICEAHLNECASCEAAFTRLLALRTTLRAPGVSYEAPAELRARVVAVLGAAAAQLHADELAVGTAASDVQTESGDVGAG